jgi:hypothetical protein
MTINVVPGCFILFIVLFVGSIINSGVNYSQRKAEMTEQCKEIDGEMYVSGKRKGWPELLCLEKGTILLKQKDLK